MTGTENGDMHGASTTTPDPRPDAAEPALAATPDTEAPEGDADLTRWEAFAARKTDAEREAPASRPHRVLAATRRLVTHEWTVVSVLALAIAAAMTWPTLRDPTRTVPQDVYDPLLQAWQVAWAGHVLLTDPVNLWNANSFYPQSDSYAFSDTLLGYAPFGVLGSGPEAALLRYNLLYVLLHALAFVGAYALARQLGARWPGAAVAGAAFAYAPWRLSQAGHMHVLSTGGIVLALAMLARGHGYSLRHGYRPERVKPGWALGGWLVAAWQMTLGFGIGLAFAYVMLGIAVVAVGWRAVSLFGRPRRRFPWRLVATDFGGGLFFTAVSVMMALPYLRVLADHPYSRRTEEEIGWYSPPLQGFLTAPGESRVWGGAHEPARAALQFPAEMTMLPGMALIALATVGLLLSIWSLWQRLFLALGVAVTVALGMGVHFFDGEYGYLLLFRHLPGWEGIRTPGRFVIWTTLLLAILAAGAVGRLAEHAQQTAETTQVDHRVPARPLLPVRLAMAIPVLLVLFEGLNLTPHPDVARAPAAMREAAGPVLVLPSGQLEDQVVMLWSTDGFPRTANGGSGFTPRKQDEIREHAKSFPAPESVDYLRELGIKTVIVRRDAVAGTP
ncbi:MAG: hypothetical protein GEU94_21215, partial [Micromonosporaceae bacterium]|nr:hypothetical protein [Micromonosporaceae bacterium]